MVDCLVFFFILFYENVSIEVALIMNKGLLLKKKKKILQHFPLNALYKGPSFFIFEKTF